MTTLAGCGRETASDGRLKQIERSNFEQTHVKPAKDSP
jgi:hypothetical protein